MNKYIKSLLAVVALTAVSQPAFSYSSCYFQDWEFTQTSKQKFSAANRAILQDLVAMDAAVSKAAKEEADAISAAVLTLSSQKAVGTTQINKAIKDNTHVQAAAMQAINQTERYRKAIRDYGAQGLGYKICDVHVKREQVKDASQATKDAVSGMVRNEITARAGRYADRNQAAATRLALHNKYYCTEGQAKAGMCDGAGTRAGKSLMASTLFQPSTYLSAEYNDKSALINNMVGLPDDPVPTEQAATASGQAYADLKRRKDAIKSTAMTSLKSIQASWSSMPSGEAHKPATESENAGVQTEKDQLAKDAPNTPIEMAKEIENDNTKPSNNAAALANNHTQSLMVQIKQDVDRYLGGGKEHQEWSQTLTGLEEKGLLSEALKIKALRLNMKTQQYSQLQRMEAMLAAMVAAQTENTGMSGRVERQRQRALRQKTLDNFQ